MKISGTFEVDLKPMDTYADGKPGVALGRMSINKTFSGALTAKSQGEMLSARAENGGAGYVALEQVSGELDGKKGAFVLQHFATMSGDGHRLTIEVVPGTGSDELDGISGTMDIRIEDGQHFYDFVYELAK